jgi:hypothetical protein
MAIASTLEADFSDFVTETMKANAAMKEMQREAVSTASAVGGTASSLDTVGGAADKSTGGVNKLSTSLRTADKTLAAFGVNMGPQISALEEMEQVSGKTAAELGILGTALSVAGAAMAGWNIGRWIAELTGADKAVADFASTLMGWGSVSQQTAEYQQELIAKAQKLDPTVRTAAEAFKVLNDAAAAQAETFNTGADRLRTWTNDLNDANTDQAKLRAEIEAGNSTVAQMAKHYNVSAEAVQYLTREMGKETTARKEAEAAAKKQTEAMAREAEERVKNADRAQKIAGDANRAWNTEVMTLSGTTTQALIANIDKWQDEQIAALDATKGATEANYATIAQVAGEKLAQVKLDWDTLKAGAIATYADQAARAEATYAEMLAHSRLYTTEAIANALKLRDETLATYEAMTSAHSAAYADFLKRDKAYADALKGFQSDAAGAAEANYQKQAAALDAAIAYSQAYGVTIDAAKVALGQMGDTGAAAGEKTGQAMAGAAQQVSQLTAVVQQSAAQMQTLARVYDQMAQRNIESGSALGTQIGMNYEESARQLRAKAGRVAQYEEAITPTTWGTRGGMTSTTTTLNVNVNNPNAQGIANALVTEMRHSGVRFG